VRQFPKLVRGRTHEGHLSFAQSSYQLILACSIHNFCLPSSTVYIYMHTLHMYTNPYPPRLALNFTAASLTFYYWLTISTGVCGY
jgi:hypothetical protein